MSVLRYGKTGNKKWTTCFATLLQNELNSDVVRFTTPVQTCFNNLICFKTGFIWVVNAQHLYSTRFVAMLQNKLHVFCYTFFCTFKQVEFRENARASFPRDKANCP